MEMRIMRYEGERTDFINLLLLADESRHMIDRYIDRGEMYILEDECIVKGECLVTDEGGGILEIKNIAVLPQYSRMGYGRAMIDYLSSVYSGAFSILQAGTGDSPLTIPFYEKCGFKRSHVIRNFFTDNYDHPIFECGMQLVDMIIMRKSIS